MRKWQLVGGVAALELEGSIDRSELSIGTAAPRMQDMAEEKISSDSTPLNGDHDTPDYDAIFADERKHSHFAQKTAFGQVSGQ